MTKINRQLGFTLVELLIVVVVIAVLASLAGPAADLIQKRRLVSAAEALYGHLQLARSEAIRQGVDMHLNYQSNGSSTWCLGINDGANCDCTETVNTEADYCGIPLSGSGDEVRQVVTSADYSNVSAPTTWAALPTGTALGSPVNLTLNFVRGSVSGIGGTERFFYLQSSSGQEMAVAMNVLGRVRVCSPSGATNVPGYSTC